MIRHIVMWILNDDLGGKTKAEVIDGIKADFDQLMSNFPELVMEYKVSANVNPAEQYDLVLNAVYKNLDDLKTYSFHPLHVAFGQNLKKKVSVRSAIDYEI